MNVPLIKEFHYNAPIDKVWQALTNIDKLLQWYFPQLQKFEPVVGYRFQFEDDGAAYQKEWIVTKVAAGKMLAHSWAYKGYSGSSEVIFDVFPDSNAATLRVTQTGLESFSQSSAF